MAPKPKAHNWNDVQTAIATVTIVTTLGLWNLFATPAKVSVSQVVPTTTVPPTEPPVVAEPTAMPQIKIMFTDVPQQTVTNPQPQTNTSTTTRKKKKNSNTSGGSVTTTKTS